MVIIEANVTNEWQNTVSDWLVNSGCLYMLAWGDNCSSWDDSVDYANMEKFDYAEISENQDVMTTWHNNESLDEVFDFCKRHASHPVVDIDHTFLFHISKINKERDYGQRFKNA